MCVAGDVAQRLTQGGLQLLRHVFAGCGVDRAIEQDPRFETEPSDRLVDETEDPAAQPVGGVSRSLEVEDGHADLLDGEQSLDHRVMKVAGDPFPVLEDGQLVDSGEQPSVVDRHPGGDSQADDELLVHVGEHLVARLVGEIKVAEHLVAAGAEESRALAERGRSNRPRSIVSSSMPTVMNCARRVPDSSSTP